MEPSIKTGKPAPNFTLKSLEGYIYNLENLLGKIVVLNFWSAECPWSTRADQTLKKMAAEWGSQVVILTLASNANESLEEIRRSAKDRKIPHVLLDSKQ